MKISTMSRHFREGSKNIVRNGWMSFASASAIAISLFILGVFLLLSLNVNHFADQIESQVEIKVYLELDTPQEQISKLQNEIGSLSEVNKITFVSKEEGMEFLKDKLSEDGQQWLEGFEGDNNPLNDSFTVEVKEPREVKAAAAKIENLNEGYSTAPIYKVKYGQGTVETMFKVTRAVRNIGLVLVIGLAFTAMFLIANTIKLTIMARSREISIMKLVGATNGFIRWPFFVEGTLLGLVGSIIPTGILLFGYARLVDSTKSELGVLMLELIPVSQIALQMTGLLILIGFVIGIWGSIISVRKFLNV